MELNKKLELLADVLDIDPAELKPEATLVELGWDSVALLSFIVMIDDEFHKVAKGEDIRALATVQDALDYITAAAQPNE